MRAAEFLDAPATAPVPGGAAAFLDTEPAEQTADSASAFLDSPDAQGEAGRGIPSQAELERASRPATAIRTRGGQVLFTEPESFRDVWDRDVQGEQRAPWTGEGGVLESLSAQMVASTRNAVANLKRMLAEESAAQRRPVVAGPSVGETPAGAVTGYAAPGSLERQSSLLVRDEAAIETAAREVALARGDLQLVTPHGMNTAQQAVSSLAQSAPPTALGIAAGIITRNPVLAMTIAGGGGGAIQAGATYGEAREKGAPHRLSATAATIDAILEGVGEALPLRFALKQGSPIATRIYGTMAAEAGQESATQAMQDLNALATYNPDITFNEAWDNLKVATLAGAMGGTVYGGAGAIAQAGQRPITSFDSAVTRLDQARTVDEAIGAASDAVSAPVPMPSQPATVQEVKVRARVGEQSELVRASEFLDAADRKVTARVAPELSADISVAPLTILGQSPAAMTDEALVFTASTAAPEVRAAAEQELTRRYATTELVKDGEVAEQSDAALSPVLGMPQDRGTAGVGARDYAPAKVSADVSIADPRLARPDVIRETITRLLRVPIGERYLMKRNAAGVYKVAPQTIRVRNQNDIDTISHEVGHHFSETNKTVRKLQAQHRQELLALTPEAYAKKPVKLRLEEGFAEYVRLYITQRSEAQRIAPGFTEDFNKFLDGTSNYRPIFDRLEGMVNDWYALSPAERIMAKVGRPERTIGERFAETFNKDRIIFEALDKWLPMRRMVEDLNPAIVPSRDPFKAAHLLAGDAAVIEDWIVNETTPYDYAKRADPANYGKPLREIIKPVAGNLREFSAYLIARRADELSQTGRERLFTPAEIKAGLKLETPAFRASADEVYAYNDRAMDYAVEGGLLSKDAAARFRQYTSYIPFFRESEANISRQGKGGTPFKRLRGGTANLRDPISNIVQNTANIIHATNRNAVLAKAYELAQSVPGGGRWIERIPLPTQALQVSTERILAELSNQGVVIDQATAENLATMQTFFQQQARTDDRSQTIIARVNGEPVALQINNKMLWQALQAFEPIDMGLIGKLFTVPSDLLRAGVILSPEFMSRNFMRDTLSGFIQSKAGILPMVGTVDGFKEIATRSDAARLYRAFGGAYGDLWKGDSAQTRAILERMAKRGRFDPRTILTPSGVIDVLHRLGSISEAGTRVAEFKKTMRAGDVDSLIDAAYNAREVSVDFGMHGHNRAVRILTRITPFLNPALQGFYKMGRSGSEQFFTTLLRGSMLAGASVLLYLNNKDEEWYDELEQWEKNVYWHFDVGLRSERGDVIPLRLPKPFEWGAVFGSVPEALAELAIVQNGKRFADRLASVLKDVFTLRAIPTALLVPGEQWANKNAFTGRQIVPDSKERLDPALQYGPQTSLTSRAAGELLDLSPARLDHLVRGFLGTMGLYTLMLSDEAVKLAKDYPEQPSKTWRQLPVARAFVHDPDNPNSRYITEFYELLEKARRADATLKRMTDEKADAYFEKHQNEIELVDDANRVARELAALRRDNEEIRESRELSGRDKAEIVYENTRQMKLLSRLFMRESATH